MGSFSLDFVSFGNARSRVGEIFAAPPGCVGGTARVFSNLFNRQMAEHAFIYRLPGRPSAPSGVRGQGNGTRAFPKQNIQ